MARKPAATIKTLTFLVWSVLVLGITVLGVARPAAAAKASHTLATPGADTSLEELEGYASSQPPVVTWNYRYVAHLLGLGPVTLKVDKARTARTVRDHVLDGVISATDDVGRVMEMSSAWSNKNVLWVQNEETRFSQRPQTTEPHSQIAFFFPPMSRQPFDQSEYRKMDRLSVSDLDRLFREATLSYARSRIKGKRSVALRNLQCTPEAAKEKTLRLPAITNHLRSRTFQPGFVILRSARARADTSETMHNSLRPYQQTRSTIYHLIPHLSI